MQEFHDAGILRVISRRHSAVSKPISSVRSI
jgi:hypothetical protein